MNAEKALSKFTFLGSSIKEFRISNDFVNFPYDDNAKKEVDIKYNEVNISKDEENSCLIGIIQLKIQVNIEFDEKKADFHRQKTMMKVYSKTLWNLTDVLHYTLLLVRF